MHASVPVYMHDCVCVNVFLHASVPVSACLCVYGVLLCFCVVAKG